MIQKSKKLITKIFEDYIAKFVYMWRYLLFTLFIILIIFNLWYTLANLAPSSRDMEVLKQSNGLRKFNDWSKYDLW